MRYTTTLAVICVALVAATPAMGDLFECGWVDKGRCWFSCLFDGSIECE